MNESDCLDSAVELTQIRMDDAIKESSRALRPQQIRNDDGTWPVTDCDECGNEIPEGRLLMGKIRCVYCQDRLERGLLR